MRFFGRRVPSRKEFLGAFEIIRFREGGRGQGFNGFSCRWKFRLLDLQLGADRYWTGMSMPRNSRPGLGKSALLAPFPNRLKDGRYQVGRGVSVSLNDVERVMPCTASCSTSLFA
ncbi:MAG: hypothetical protein IPJ00_10930 [Saprospirales bacterium]|nr:hypothetical protein [Saprospirales bacterium]